MNTITYLFDALVDHHDPGRWNQERVRRVRARIGKKETGQLVAEFMGVQWGIAANEIVQQFPSFVMELSDVLRAELRAHGVAEVVVTSVEVQGEGLMPDPVTTARFLMRGDARMPDKETATRLLEEVASEAETELASCPGMNGEPTGQWVIKV